MREKDTFSGLNQYSARDQDVFVFNVFRTDALNLFLPASDNLALGYTAQLSLLVNLDHGGVHYDKTGSRSCGPRPSADPSCRTASTPCTSARPGDGHIGWLNVTHAFYEVLGRDDKNGIAGHGVDINAQMFALELSRDYDYLRPKFSFFYARATARRRTDRDGLRLDHG